MQVLNTAIPSKMSLFPMNWLITWSLISIINARKSIASGCFNNQLQPKLRMHQGQEQLLGACRCYGKIE